MIIIGICSLLLLLTAVIIYRTYAIYEEKQEYNIMKGIVPNQDYDVKFAFILEDKEGNKTHIGSIPEEKNYDVTIDCNNGAVGVWDEEKWGPLIENLTVARTKCNLTFSPGKQKLIEIIKDLPKTTSGDGLYEVNHEDADITYTTDTIILSNLKQTEYRYAGLNPNNYVRFNNELWRIIGLVNTPEGQRIKIIRNESIGTYSWDSSDLPINNGNGVNEWSQSKVMNLLNHGPYYNRTSGMCYNGANNATIACDFSEMGLLEESKNMIDTITWNIGSVHNKSSNTHTFYNQERSKDIGKTCDSGSSCNDNVKRTTTWKGQIGLMYPSDFGYATSGGTTANREECLNTEIYGWNHISVSDCKYNNWLYDDSNVQGTITPGVRSVPYGSASLVWGISYSSWTANTGSAANADSDLPTLYLKSNIKLVSGNGTIDSPYELSR